MRYFVLRVFFAAEGGAQSNSVQTYTSKDDAFKRYYTVLASDIGNDNYSYEIVQIIRDDGTCLASQVFRNDEPEPQE